MRVPSARSIASSALCATLLLGIAAPAAMAADRDSARGRTHTAAPVPGADALLAQVPALADISGVLAPVTDLLNAALKADDGQLSADEAARLDQAVKDAIAKVTAATPVTPPVTPPETPAASTTPATTDKAPGVEGARAEAPTDLKGEALSALQTAVDTLLKAVTSGDATQVVPAATAVVTGLVNFVVATVLGGGLPAADLPGLPTLPSLTNTLPTKSLPTRSLPTSDLPPTS